MLFEQIALPPVVWEVVEALERTAPRHLAELLAALEHLVRSIMQLH